MRVHLQSFITTGSLIVFLVAVISAHPRIIEDKEILSRVKRVIGGEEIEEGAWPWLAHLEGKVPVRWFFGIPIAHEIFYCGGSVINHRWILTAAHCFKQGSYSANVMVPKYWHIKVGNTESHSHIYDRPLSAICQFLQIASCQTFRVHADRIHIHPHYDERNSWNHDIALIRLEADIPVWDDEFSDIIQAVRLPLDQGYDWPPNGAECWMKGWGCSENGGPLEDTARAVRLPKYSDPGCNNIYAVSTRSRLCAGSTTGGTGICKGDSGGPLVCLNGNVWTQAGIASFTSAESPERYPGVFTRVSEYVAWIRSHVH